MSRENYNDLHAFLLVARKGSFTRAAAEVGVSQSALSQTIRGLEERLGIRLLTRTTRSVSPTEAGERLLLTLAPRFEEIEAELAALSELRDKPAGTVRITASDHAIDAIRWPKLTPLLRKYPDIVAERYDASVRFGEQVGKDMIAVRIGPETSMAAVAAPSYFSNRPRPRAPPSGLYAWGFEKDGRELNVHVSGQLTFNGINQVLNAALAGFGIAYIPDDLVREPIAKGCLVRVLEDCSPPFPGFHLYYPSRRQTSPAFALVVEALRYRE